LSTPFITIQPTPEQQSEDPEVKSASRAPPPLLNSLRPNQIRE